MAEVHEERVIFFGERFKVTGENGKIFHIRGDIGNWQFKVQDDTDKVIANISRQFRGSYVVDVAPDADAPFVVTLVLVLELTDEHQGKTQGFVNF
jgi:uncharacterized protein YxjI